MMGMVGAVGTTAAYTTTTTTTCRGHTGGGGWSMEVLGEVMDACQSCVQEFVCGACITCEVVLAQHARTHTHTCLHPSFGSYSFHPKDYTSCNQCEFAAANSV